MIKKIQSNMIVSPKFFDAYIYDTNNDVAHKQDLYTRLDWTHLELQREILRQLNPYIFIFEQATKYIMNNFNDEIFVVLIIDQKYLKKLDS